MNLLTLAKWPEVIIDIIKSSKREAKDSHWLLTKITEELGELAAEHGKRGGMTAKPYDKQEHVEEVADVLICVFSYFAKLSAEDEDFTQEMLVEAMKKKISKWNEKADHYRCHSEGSNLKG